jgi:hypothetical protein
MTKIDKDVQSMVSMCFDIKHKLQKPLCSHRGTGCKWCACICTDRVQNPC